LLHGSRIYIPDHGDLRHQAITFFYENQAITLAHTASHECIQKTLQRLRRDFFIVGDYTLV
jgi:hypothetical protein